MRVQERNGAYAPSGLLKPPRPVAGPWWFPDYLRASCAATARAQFSVMV